MEITEHGLAAHVIRTVFNKKAVHIQEEFYSKLKLCRHIHALFSGRIMFIFQVYFNL